MDTEKQDFSAKTGDIVPAAGGGKLNFFARVGHLSVKVGAALLLGLIKGVKLILSELLELAVSLLKVLLWILRELTSPLRNRFNINKDMQKKVMKAKKAGKSEYN